MTSEQLDEIEKRWDGYLEKGEVERRFLFDRWWDKRDFWDMTKALREAWAERDAAKECIRCDSKFSDYCSICWDSRDTELRAEVERLRGAITRFVDQYPWQQGPEIQELKALNEKLRKQLPSQD